MATRLVAALLAATLLSPPKARPETYRAHITTNGTTEGTLLGWEPSTGEIYFFEHTWIPSITRHTCRADGSFSTPGHRCVVETGEGGRPEVITVSGPSGVAFRVTHQ